MVRRGLERICSVDLIQANHLLTEAKRPSRGRAHALYAEQMDSILRCRLTLRVIKLGANSNQIIAEPDRNE